MAAHIVCVCVIIISLRLWAICSVVCCSCECMCALFAYSVPCTTKAADIISLTRKRSEASDIHAPE